MNYVKRIIVLIALLWGTNGTTQGTQFGVNISPGIKILSSKQIGTNLRSYNRGYGFNVGIPVKVWLSEFTAYHTGLDFEFSAFDSFLNGQLVSSFRMSGIYMPMLAQFHLRGNFYGILGGGLTYNFAVRDLNVSQGVDLSAVSNQFQPNLGVGISSLVDKNFGSLELGGLVRFQPISLWKKDYLPFQGYTQRLFSLEFILRYYF